MDGSNQHDHHVHFDAAVMKSGLHDNSIIYQVATTANSIMIHLGFLQINHRYRIELNIPVKPLIKSGLRIGQNSDFLVEESKLPNIHCKLLEFPTKFLVDSEGEDNMTATIEFFAHKEKLVKEHLHVCGKQDSHAKFDLILIARVLGRGKGTPMLRDGIHLIAVEDDEESELSDWQGFSKKE
ncbi:adipose-secreted signaling protein-like [Armigeres subalbatus]|uniref:adipose-secreted signaling protein-like n=1 Tax=Armigeres subalbatus TaxID=124917 RepID=UPI002ED29394